MPTALWLVVVEEEEEKEEERQGQLCQNLTTLTWQVTFQDDSWHLQVKFILLPAPEISDFTTCHGNNISKSLP